MKYRYFVQLSVILFIVAIISGCYRGPDFPTTPVIKFTSNDVRDQVQYYDNLNKGDSLVINILIQDGNGDVGLSSEKDKFPNDDQIPYQPSIYFDSITSESSNVFITNAIKFGYIDNGIAIRTTLNDTIPPYQEPYSRLNYVIHDLGGSLNIYYVQPNPNNKNIFISFYVKDNQQDEFEKYSLEENIGNNFNARIPRLSEDNSPLESILAYSMVSGINPLKLFFKEKILKLRIFIKDRELNSSNVIETEPFTLVQVQVN